MKRFFFDYKAKDALLLDYRGQEFTNPAGAFDFAQEMAFGLKHSISVDWNGWSIEVRATDGEKIFSLPIECEMAA
ncbi:MAG: hypothetical protein WBE99_06825 [Xanthobacteraceae bacterium]